VGQIRSTFGIGPWREAGLTAVERLAHLDASADEIRTRGVDVVDHQL
jgi:hypothetical protein